MTNPIVGRRAVVAAPGVSGHRRRSTWLTLARRRLQSVRVARYDLHGGADELVLRARLGPEFGDLDVEGVNRPGDLLHDLRVDDGHLLVHARHVLAHAVGEGDRVVDVHGELDAAELLNHFADLGDLRVHLDEGVVDDLLLLRLAVVLSLYGLCDLLLSSSESE